MVVLLTLWLGSMDDEEAEDGCPSVAADLRALRDRLNRCVNDSFLRLDNVRGGGIGTADESSSSSTRREGGDVMVSLCVCVSAPWVWGKKNVLREGR